MNKCTECNREMKVNPNVTLMSHPPEPSYYCEECNPRMIIRGIDNTITFEITPTEVEPKTFISIEGVGMKELQPLDDITAIELYQIMCWKEYCSRNPYIESNFLWKKAVELGIERHFRLDV